MSVYAGKRPQLFFLTPSCLSGLPGDLLTPIGRQLACASLATLPAAPSGILLTIWGSVLFNFACGNLGDRDSISYYVGGSFLSLGAFGHTSIISRPSPFFTLLSRGGWAKLDTTHFFVKVRDRGVIY